VLNVRAEAQRISKEAGVSARSVAGELVVVGIRARANIEFPRLAGLGPPDASKAAKAPIKKAGNKIRKAIDCKV
jgi:hypothetical protein